MIGYSSKMRLIQLAIALLLLSGTAAPALANDANDPLEGLNRKTYALNEWLDRNILGPVARGWKFITPGIVRSSIQNFDDNLRSPVIVGNDILQWKWRAAGEQVARFSINTTIGILGFRDVAVGWGLEKQFEDTGQTFGVWGIPPGPYIVLPVFGPSNPRDIVGIAGDSILSIYWIFAPWYASFSYRTVDVINDRAVFDEQIESTRAAALDHYVFIRSAYRQRRDALIRDMSAEESEDDLYELDDDLYDFEDDEE